MSLNIYSYYQTFKPHFSYRFKVDFLANPSLSRLVKDIKLPSISINASDGRKRFGNTQIVLPFFEFGDQELEITFVETDDMKVLQHLTSMLNWPNNPIEEVINVTEYDDTLRNVIHVTEYVIAIYSFNSPQWQNAGGGSNKMDLSATYVVRSVRDITKEDQSGLYELPYWAPQPNIKQDLNMIGSSVDEGVSEDEWNKFLDSLYNPASKIEAPLSIPPSGGDPNPQNPQNPENPQNPPAPTQEPQQNGAVPQQAGGALAQRLSGHALNEYNEYIAKLKQKDKNFDETKDAFIFFDMATNTKYAVKNGQIVREYIAYTAASDSSKKNGEAPEGVYKMRDVKVPDDQVQGSKHAAKKQTVQNLCKTKGISADALERDIAAGKYKNMKEALEKNGISTKGATYTYSYKDEKTGKWVQQTKAMTDSDFDYSSYSKYSKNLIDEGNVNGYRETESSGINSHINYKENSKEVKEYEKKRAAGTNTAEDDLKIRKFLASKSATQGCSVMSAEDINWEKSFMEENGGTIYEVKANGTSAGNITNDKKIDVAQSKNNANKVNV